MLRLAFSPELIRRNALDELRNVGFWSTKAFFPYMMVRAVRPSVVVETGVANGVSSFHILLAMEKNQKGHLYSIDLPDPAMLPKSMEPGWVVPLDLRHRWTIKLGDSTIVLPALLTDLVSIDIFSHDSLHTYEHMLFEYQTAWSHIVPDGLLYSDDVLWNSAFRDFRTRGNLAKMCYDNGSL